MAVKELNPHFPSDKDLDDSKAEKISSPLSHLTIRRENSN